MLEREEESGEFKMNGKEEMDGNGTRWNFAYELVGRTGRTREAGQGCGVRIELHRDSHVHHFLSPHSVISSLHLHI